MTDLTRYRPCVGIVIFNQDGHVWLGKRFGQDDPYTWQFPQGGIDDGETARDAALREIYEETGIQAHMLHLLSTPGDWLIYDFPPGYTGRFVRMQNWHGQKQKWFAFRFHGQDSDVNLRAHPPQEFSEWRWAELTESAALIVPFKRKVYEQVIDIFAPYATPYK